jgi:hypothetical protein
VGLPKAGRDESLDGTTQQLVALVSEHLESTRIDVQDRALRIDQDDPVWRRLEQCPVFGGVAVGRGFFSSFHRDGV